MIPKFFPKMLAPIPLLGIPMLGGYGAVRTVTDADFFTVTGLIVFILGFMVTSGVTGLALKALAKTMNQLVHH